MNKYSILIPIMMMLIGCDGKVFIGTQVTCDNGKVINVDWYVRNKGDVISWYEGKLYRSYKVPEGVTCTQEELYGVARY